MKKVALLRFGNSPSREVSEALAPHIVRSGIATQVPGAILSVFNTNSDIEVIADAIRSTGALFTISEWNPKLLQLPPELMLEIDTKVPNQNPEPQKREWTLDELLDLINKGGVDSLTQEQKIQLEGYSQ